jgi:putative Holliday junction resolvase
MTRVLGVDLGERRIGLALSDPGRSLASPLQTLERGAAPADDHRAIARVVDEWEVGLVVVGLPLSLDGSIGPAAAKVLDELQAIRDATECPVETYDERFTTVTADRLLAAQDLDSRRRRTRVDQAAAAVLLQAWLDAQPAARAGGDDTAREGPDDTARTGA